MCGQLLLQAGFWRTWLPALIRKISALETATLRDKTVVKKGPPCLSRRFDLCGVPRFRNKMQADIGCSPGTVGRVKPPIPNGLFKSFDIQIPYVIHALKRSDVRVAFHDIQADVLSLILRTRAPIGFRASDEAGFIQASVVETFLGIVRWSTKVYQQQAD